MVSQVLTLYTTPVLYLYLDRFRLAAQRRWRQAFPASLARRERRNDVARILSPSPCGRGLGEGRVSGTTVHRPPPSSPSRKGRGSRSRRAPVAVSCAALAACMVGPDYQRPDAPVPVAYKELQGWTTAQPQDAADRGAWWSDLPRSGTRPAGTAGRGLQPDREAVRGGVPQRGGAGGGGAASLFPTVAPDRERDARSRIGGGSGPVARPAAPWRRRRRRRTRNTPWKARSVGTSDVWGRVRRQVESQVAAAQVSAADLANAKLSAQATLATDYFDLRAEDSLERTAARHRRRLSSAPCRSCRTSIAPAPRPSPMW